MLVEILEGIVARDRGIVIVAEVDRREALAVALAKPRADISVLGEAGRMELTPPFARDTGLWVLLLSPSGRSAMLRRRERVPQCFENPSAEATVAGIKDAVRPQLTTAASLGRSGRFNSG
jgi:hypothetical protein